MWNSTGHPDKLNMFPTSVDQTQHKLLEMNRAGTSHGREHFSPEKRCWNVWREPTGLFPEGIERCSLLRNARSEHTGLDRSCSDLFSSYKCPVWSRVYLVVNLSTLSPSRNFMALQWILPQFSGCPRGPSSSWMYCSHRSAEETAEMSSTRTLVEPLTVCVHECILNRYLNEICLHNSLYN